MSSFLQSVDGGQLAGVGSGWRDGASRRRLHRKRETGRFCLREQRPDLRAQALLAIAELIENDRNDRGRELAQSLDPARLTKIGAHGDFLRLIVAFAHWTYTSYGTHTPLAEEPGKTGAGTNKRN